MLHLLHPAMVHFSVAFLVAGGLCEIWGILRGRAGLERLGVTLVLLGAASLIPTVVTGLLAKNSIALPAGTADDVELHERLGFGIAALFFVTQFWKAWNGGSLSEGQRKVYAFVLALGVLLVVAGAVTGGHMVYDHAVGIDATSRTGP